MTAAPPAGRIPRRFSIAIAVAVFFGLLLALFGGALVAASQKDYSAYTEPATATISDVVRTSSGAGQHHSTSYKIYLDFEADGRSFTHRRLQGVTMGTPHVGDTVELLFPPGEPDRAVTALTTSKTTARVELWIGIGLLVVSAGIFVGVLARAQTRRRRRAQVTGAPGTFQTGAFQTGAFPSGTFPSGTFPSGTFPTGAASPGAAVTVPAPVAVADPRLLPVPWPWEQVVAQLARAAGDTPFSVVALADGGVEVSYAVADARWFTLFQAHRLASTLVCRLEPKAPGKYARNDSLYDVEWSGGVGHLRGSERVQSGRVWAYRRRVEYGVGTDGSVGRQVDVTFSSSDVPRWIDAVLAGSGWTAALDRDARIGVAAAVFGGVVAVGAVVVALVAALVVAH